MDETSLNQAPDDSDVQPESPAGDTDLSGRETVLPGESAAAGTSGSGTSQSGTLPEVFGRYRVQKLLGQGAMGAVYLAHDTQLDRSVALKTPKIDENDPDLLERFYREARSAATLRHANVCPVYDIGEIDRTRYISMAYIEGRPLSDFVKGEKTPTARQLALVIRKMALGLAAAHGQGIVHRDLKPANVMIDVGGDPVIMDFGLARQLNTRDESRITQSGSILGSPAYMSPEQVEADLDRIGPATDIYSLGVILYELLCGRTPFTGSLAVVLGRIALDTPDPPSAHRPDIDRRLEAICQKMMARQIEDRYASMPAVAAALTEYIKASKSPPPTPTAPTTDKTAEPADEPDSLWERQQQQIRVHLKRKELAEAVEVLETLAGNKHPQAEPYVIWAAGELDKVKAEREAIEAQRSAARQTAEKLIREHDYEQAIQLIEQIPEDLRTNDVNALHSQVVRLNDEVTFLLGEIDEIVSGGGKSDELEPKLRRLLVLKPGHARAKKLLARIKEVKPKRGGRKKAPRQQSPQSRKVQATSALGWLTEDWRIMAAVGVGVFAVMSLLMFNYLGDDGQHPEPKPGPDKPGTTPVLPGILTEVRRFETGHKQPIIAVEFSPDGRRFLSAGGDVHLGEVDGKQGPRILTRRGNMLAAAFSRDGRLAAAGGIAHFLEVWKTDTGERLHKFEGHSGTIYSIAFTQDGRNILSYDSSGIAIVWDLAAGREERRFKCPPGKPMVLTPDGHVLTRREGGGLEIRSFQSGEVLRELRDDHRGVTSSIAVDAGGRRAASGGRDGIVRLWDFETGMLLKRFEKHDGEIRSIRFSPDGRLLFSGGFDRTLRVWDVKSGRELQRIETETAYTTRLAVSPDGRYLLSGGGQWPSKSKLEQTGDYALRLWRVEPAGLTPTEILTSPDWEWAEPVALKAPINVNNGARSGAALAADGLTLLYHSNQPGGLGGSDLWQSTRSDHSAPWSKPINLGKLVNSADNEGEPALSADGLTLLFHSNRPGGQGRKDLWKCTRTSIDGPWSEPVNLGPLVNSAADETGPTLSANGLLLVFASDRAGGLGVGDLWMSTRRVASDLWQKPVHLGTDVNTGRNESAPHLSSDGLTLIFNTTRNDRMELWMMTRGGFNDLWPKPTRLGPPINSANFQESPSLSADARVLFFTAPHGRGSARFLWQSRRVKNAGVAGDPDRAAAEWVLGLGGEISTEEGNFTKADRLPQQPFRITVVFLKNNKQMTDADLLRLKGLSGLRSLLLPLTQVSDAGLVHLKGLTNLKVLSLLRTKITDAGLEHLSGLTGLRNLHLADTKVGDGGLAHLKGLSQLNDLILAATSISDAGLQHLEGMTSLETLDLRNTKVSDSGAAKLHQALPKCKIRYGRGDAIKTLGGE